MAKAPKPNPLNYSPLALSPAMANDMNEVQTGRYRWIKQPQWPHKNIHFKPRDRGDRRALIEALMDKAASHAANYIGYQLLNCNPLAWCKSPLCNYCRTKLQDREQAKVLAKFNEFPEQDIFFLTILDDLTETPLVDAAAQINTMRLALHQFFKHHFSKEVSVYGIFEIDAKEPTGYTASATTLKLLTQYGLKQPYVVNYMPHFHGLVALNGITRASLRNRLIHRFPKSNQVVLKKLQAAKSKQDNLADLARYMTKFQYRYAVNTSTTSNKKPTYKIRMNDDDLRVYAELIHQLKGTGGIRSMMFKHNV